MASRTSAPATRGADRDGDRARTPAQWYCTIAGAVLTLVGLLGFIANSSFSTGSSVDGDSLLGFEVNGWHNLVHLASGVFLLAMARRRRTAATGALAFGVVYGAVAVWGLVDGDDVLGLIPINPADNILHVALAALGIIAGAVSAKDDATRARGSTADAAAGPRRSSEPAVPELGANERGERFDHAADDAPAPRPARRRDEGLRKRQ